MLIPQQRIRICRLGARGQMRLVFVSLFFGHVSWTGLTAASGVAHIVLYPYRGRRCHSAEYGVALR
jgi:hypothetical protein